MASVDPAWLKDNADFTRISKSLKKLRPKNLRHELEVKGLSRDGLSKVLLVRLAVAMFIEEFGVPVDPAKKDQEAKTGA